ncbi:MAG: hypothetical protein AAFY26_05335 [Cyanobacteria bacterium J06638_22]
MTNPAQPNLSFDALVEAIRNLDLPQKGKLFAILDDLLFDAEAAAQGDPTVLVELEEARQAYEAGIYRTVQAVWSNSLE